MSLLIRYPVLEPTTTMCGAIAKYIPNVLEMGLASYSFQLFIATRDRALMQSFLNFCAWVAPSDADFASMYRILALLCDLTAACNILGIGLDSIIQELLLMF